MPAPLPPDRLRGLLLGTRLGDALGMPLDGLSHQNVRLYYRGVKGLVADEKRDIPAGTGTAITRAMDALARGDAPPELPEAAALAASVVLLGAPDAEARLTKLGLSPEAWIATHAHHAALAHLAALPPDAFDPAVFWAALRTDVAASAPLAAVLAALDGHLDLFPLDLHDLVGGTEPVVEEVWPFALAMFARGPHLVEATLLSAVNVGGAAPTVGALIGGLLGALHGPDVFPAAWVQALR